MLIHVPQNESALFVASCSMVTAHQPVSVYFCIKLRHLKLVGLLSAGAGPLVAGSVGELVAVGRDKVVKDGGSTGAWENLLVCLNFEMLEPELVAYRRGSPWG